MINQGSLIVSQVNDDIQVGALSHSKIATNGQQVYQFGGKSKLEMPGACMKLDPKNNFNGSHSGIGFQGRINHFFTHVNLNYYVLGMGQHLNQLLNDI